MSEKLLQAWYKGHWALVFFAPLSWLYRWVMAVRRMVYKYYHPAVATFPVPIIVIGNITVGGTGKTPLTLALVKHLQAQGFRPAVISRGYGGQTVYPALVSAQSTAAEVGDEPLLIYQQSLVPVVVAPKRAQAVAWLLERQLCDVILADDGLQHYALARDIEIVVIDAERGLGNEKLLPQGPLREAKKRLQSVDYVVLNGHGYDYPQAYTMSLQPSTWLAVGNVTAQLPLPPQTIHAVAGIGHPERFFASLVQQGFQVIKHPLPDHHFFTASDVSFADDLPIVMTAKDAVKCHAFARENMWQVPVVAKLSPEFYQHFDKKLAMVCQAKKLAKSLIE